VLIFDEFQILIKSPWKEPLLTALKTCRSNAGLPGNAFCPCLAFGTYNITQLSATGKSKSLSPFPTSNMIHFESPDPVLLTETLTTFRKHTIPYFADGIIEDIVQSSGGHLGIFGQLAKKLYDLIEIDGKWSLSAWTKKKADLYESLHKNRPFHQITKALQVNDSALYLFIKKSKNFWRIQFFLPESSERDILFDIGVLTFVPGKQSESLCMWTSPIIKEYIIQYCALCGSTIYPPLPTTGKDKVNYLALFEIIGNTVDTPSIMADEYSQTKSFNPTEASIHVEVYRMLKGMFNCSPFKDLYHIKFEGRTVGKSRRFDLLIRDGETVVIELKIKANTEKLLQSALNQVWKYGDAINATRCFVINCTNFEPSHNGFTLKPQVEDSDGGDDGDDGDGDDSDYCEMEETFEEELYEIETREIVPVQVVHLVYSEDWKTLVNVIHQ